MDISSRVLGKNNAMPGGESAVLYGEDDGKHQITIHMGYPLSGIKKNISILRNGPGSPRASGKLPQRMGIFETAKR